MDLSSFIRDVPDFPKPGIVFKDITPILLNPEVLAGAADGLADAFRDDGVQVVAGAEARGFIFGPLVAIRLKAGFVPVRRLGKLPGMTRRVTYALEYGSDTLEIHQDAIQPGMRVLMIDDLLATGGTMRACAQLVEDLGGSIVGCAFVIELAYLTGRRMLGKYRVESLVKYDQE